MQKRPLVKVISRYADHLLYRALQTFPSFLPSSPLQSRSTFAQLETLINGNFKIRHFSQSIAKCVRITKFQPLEKSLGRCNDCTEALHSQLVPFTSFSKLVPAYALRSDSAKIYYSPGSCSRSVYHYFMVICFDFVEKPLRWRKPARITNANLTKFLSTPSRITHELRDSQIRA